MNDTLLKSKVGTRITPELRERLEALAIERGWALGSVLRDALVRYVDDDQFDAGPTPADTRSRWRASSS